ncbi:hypothetical protein D3C81_1807470 [compost metagenome]
MLAFWSISLAKDTRAFSPPLKEETRLNTSSPLNRKFPRTVRTRASSIWGYSFQTSSKTVLAPFRWDCSWS